MNLITKDFKEPTTETYEYEMSSALAKSIFEKQRKKIHKIESAEAQKILCQFVNNEFCLKGICTGVKVR